MVKICPRVRFQLSHIRTEVVIQIDHKILPYSMWPLARSMESTIHQSHTGIQKDDDVETSI